MGVSVFTDPLIDATGLSRLALSNAYLLGTLMSGLLLPMGGVLLDRFGARLLAVFACGGLAATLIFLSRIDRVIAASANWTGGVSTEIVSGIVLTLAFGCLRFSGQGLLTMSSRAMVSKWFERRRGLVAGIVGVFINFGFSLAPVGLLAWIAVAGWRGAWIGMAAAIGLGMLGVAYLFFRDNPEECGLRMDGEDPSTPLHRSKSSTAVSAEVSFTRSEALRTRVFWMVTLALCVQSMVFTGVTFHIVDIGAMSGLSREAAVALFVPIAAIGVPIGFLVGAAADHVSLRMLVVAMSICQIVGFVGVAYVGDFWFRSAAVLGWGLSQGFFGPLTTVAIPKLFGRQHLGA